MSEDDLKFELWLETEAGDPSQPANRSHENFCNLTVKTSDGREFALNVWTFDFLPHARKPWPYGHGKAGELASYVFPPDLFVESLDRDLIERVVSDLLARGEMREEWLVDSEGAGG